jgi:Tfp pilus assembly protein PilO
MNWPSRLDQALDRLQPRQLRLLLGGGLLLLATALFFQLLWPQVKGYRALRNSHAILLASSGSQTDLARQVAALKGEVDELRHRLQGDLGDLPPKQVEAHVIGLLQQLCWRHRLELASVRPEAGEEVHVFRETVFDVEVHGDYADFFAWLAEARDKLGFLVVKHYEIAPLEADQAQPRLAVKLHIGAWRKVGA